TGCDGIMIGRGMFGNPWVFADLCIPGLHKSCANQVCTIERTLEEKLAALVELAHGFEAIVPQKNFSLLKKHIKAFVTGFDGAAELRARLMQAEYAHEIESIVLVTARMRG
ncbi:MAG: tRNA-dihydrouridine synthase, partial [Candidatus Paceibacterota bacterium]